MISTAMNQPSTNLSQNSVRLLSGLPDGWSVEQVAYVAQPTAADGVDLIALNEALQELEASDPDKAELVRLRYFAGLTEEEAAQALNISRATAARWWAFAKAWLFQRMRSAP